MPYINQEVRSKLEPDIKNLALKITDLYDHFEPGVLNYAITKLILELKIPESYINHNAVIGALECAKTEYYRRKIIKYEDQKIISNGDVYE